MKTQEPELLDIKQAAALLHVTETTLRRWTNSGRLACLRIGSRRERRFRRADLVALLEAQPRLAAGDAPEPVDAPAQGTLIAGVPVAHGTHLCSIYSSDDGQTKLAVGFLADGLVQGSACYLVAGPHATRNVLAQLADVDSVRADLDAGLLTLCGYQLTGAQHLEWLEASFVAALRKGARSIRLVGNVSDDEAGLVRPFENITRYEEAYDRLLAKRFPLVTLCQYDARRYTGVELCEILKRHRDVFQYPPDRLLF
jgi:transcriptional repressor of dcmA and dcmR